MNGVRLSLRDRKTVGRDLADEISRKEGEERQKEDWRDPRKIEGGPARLLLSGTALASYYSHWWCASCSMFAGMHPPLGSKSSEEWVTILFTARTVVVVKINAKKSSSSS